MKEPPAGPTMPRAPNGILTLPPSSRQAQARVQPRPVSLGSVRPLHTAMQMSWSRWDGCSRGSTMGTL